MIDREASMADRLYAPGTVPCPKCGASIGQKCLNELGKPRATGWHKERKNAATPFAASGGISKESK